MNVVLSKIVGLFKKNDKYTKTVDRSCNYEVVVGLTFYESVFSTGKLKFKKSIYYLFSCATFSNVVFYVIVKVLSTVSLRLLKNYPPHNIHVYSNRKVLI